MRNEHLGERWFLMDDADYSRLFYSGDHGVHHGRNRRDALHLPGKTSFTEEVVRSKNCDDCFLALLRSNGDLHLAFLDVENRITGVTCEKTTWPLRYLPRLRPLPTLARKDVELNDDWHLTAMARPWLCAIMGCGAAVYHHRAVGCLSKIAHSEPAVATDVSVWPLESPRRRSRMSGLRGKREGAVAQRTFRTITLIM
jgi:hypothetical protein